MVVHQLVNQAAESLNQLAVANQHVQMHVQVLAPLLAVAAKFQLATPAAVMDTKVVCWLVFSSTSIAMHAATSAAIAAVLPAHATAAVVV